MAGPLSGYRIVELTGLGPAPFAGMMLADMGAEVLRIDRASDVRAGGRPSVNEVILGRSRRSVAVDLKADEGRAVLLKGWSSMRTL